MLRVNVEDTFERMGRSGEDDQVFMMHPEECLQVYNYVAEIERLRSRDEWLWLIVTMVVYLGLIFGPTLIGEVYAQGQGYEEEGSL